MESEDTSQTSASDQAGEAATDVPIAQLMLEVYESAPPDLQNRLLAQLIGGVYESATPIVRSRLIEQLLRPLSVLSLATLAHGIFAKIRFRNEWQQWQVTLEDAQDVQASEVLALADYVQQVSAEAVNGLAQIVAASPMMTASAAAAVLVTLLIKRSRSRRAEDK